MKNNTCHALERGEVCPRGSLIRKSWGQSAMLHWMAVSVARLMKPVSRLRLTNALVRLVCCLALGPLAHSSWADAIAHPAYITGEIKFGNTNQRILNLLNVTHPYGIFKGNSLSPAPPLNFNVTEDFIAGAASLSGSTPAVQRNSATVTETIQGQACGPR